MFQLFNDKWILWPSIKWLTEELKTVEEEPSDLSQDLHDSDGGALAEDESSAEQGHRSPDCEGDSGEDKVRCD